MLGVRHSIGELVRPSGKIVWKNMSARSCKTVTPCMYVCILTPMRAEPMRSFC
jgi:hypothetical protein